MARKELNGGGLVLESRWFRQNTSELNQDWLNDISPGARWAWIRLIAYVKDTAPSQKRPNTAEGLTVKAAARIWAVDPVDVENAINAATESGNLVVEGTAWIVTDSSRFVSEKTICRTNADKRGQAETDNIDDGQTQTIPEKSVRVTETVTVTDTDSNPSLRSGLREGEREKSDRLPAQVFRPPTQAEVRAVMIANHGLSDSDADREAATFWGHYDGFGWRVNGNPIVKWESLVQKWVTTSQTPRFKADSKPPPRTLVRQESMSETIDRRIRNMERSETQ